MSAYKLFHLSTTGFRHNLAVEQVSSDLQSCSCCKRQLGDVEDPNVFVLYQYSAGYATERYCTTCYTPRIGSVPMLGVDRFSSNKIPVGAKLGMLFKNGGLITNDGRLQLAVDLKQYKKISDGSLATQGLVHVLSSWDLLLAENEKQNLEKPFIFIEAWGTKTDGLMSNLATSYSKRELWVNTHSGAYCVDFQSFLDVVDWVITHDLRDVALRDSFWKPIIKAAWGAPDEKEFAKWAKKINRCEELLALLPANPHDRILARKLVPLILQGSEE